MNEQLTIFTPTFNRPDFIKKLYAVMCKQTFKNFIWIVIDDGSSTNENAKIFNNAENSNFIYVYQANAGKYLAYNKAVEMCKTEFFCCLDDDDDIDVDFIENIYNNLKDVKNEIGLVFPRNKKIDNVNLGLVDIPELRLIKHVKTETTIVVKSEIAKSNLFPSFCGEKFASEEIIYIGYSYYGKFRFVNIPLVSSQYLKDGLTNNLFKLRRNNVQSSYALFNNRYNYLKKYKFRDRIIARFKCLLNYYSVILFNKKIPCFKILGNYIYFLPCILTGILLYLSKKKNLT